ncbi:hypothetical protein Tco_1491126, partial [Tanacetum coccineum]
MVRLWWPQPARPPPQRWRQAAEHSEAPPEVQPPQPNDHKCYRPVVADPPPTPSTTVGSAVSRRCCCVASVVRRRAGEKARTLESAGEEKSFSLASELLKLGFHPPWQSSDLVKIPSQCR